MKPDKTEFTECWRTSFQRPYIMRLALSAGIGGLLFGYDTGKLKLNFNSISLLLSHSLENTTKVVILTLRKFML